MHYAFDEWMRRNLPRVPFERYADDVVIHCVSREQAELVLEAVRRRLRDCKLELHPEKTRIVYCKDDRRRGDFGTHTFDFLGYTFRPRTSCVQGRRPFLGFLPAISDKAAKQIKETVRGWRLKAWGTSLTLTDVAERLNPAVRGWVAYYGRFYRSKCLDVLGHYLTETLVRWKYKRFRRKWGRAYCWLGNIAARNGGLFYHWSLGLRPTAGR
jgi:hypothetical protein